MAIERVNDPRAFRDFLDATLIDREDLTLDEAFEMWHFENTTEEERQEALEAIRQGLADIDLGQVRPIESFDRDFRERHGFSIRP